MTLKLELPPEREAALKAAAQAQGVSTEQWLERLVEERLQIATEPEFFWKTFTRRMHALPAEAFEHLPTDGASEHDHYLYGSPKKNP